MDGTKAEDYDKCGICNSAVTAGPGAHGPNPRMMSSEWSNLKFVGRHGAFALFTAMRYGRKFFIKGLSEEYRALPEWQRLLFKEFELGMQIDHPCIARTTAWEMLPGIGEAMVMEYVDGSGLCDWLNSDKARDRRARLNVVLQIVEALEYIHSMGISHRDLKPDNVLVTYKGNRVKIIDFGLGDGDDFVVYKRSAGTKAFGAPEQMADKGHEASMSADIYALGKIMALMLPGRNYRRIIARCLRAEELSRPTATSVMKSLQKSRRLDAPRILLLIVVLLTLSAIACALILKKPTQAEPPAPPVRMVTDTVVLQKVDTVRVVTPAGPSESAIRAVWDKTVKDIEPQIKFFATHNFPDPEAHRDDIDKLIPGWEEHLYYSLLEIGCTEETAKTKRKELGTYMRRRFRECKTAKTSTSTSTDTITSL